MLISLLMILTIVAIGTGLTTWMSDRLRFEERLAIGAVAGVLAVSVTNLLAFVAIGMGWGSLSVGLLLPGSAAVLGARYRLVRSVIALSRRSSSHDWYQNLNTVF